MRDPLSISESVQRLERYCVEKNYEGHSKFDALNSPFFEKLFGFSSVSRLVVTQAVNRIPFPLREVFGVREGRNPKGVANFVRGYANLYRGLGDEGARKKALILADWLLEHSSNRVGAYEGKGEAWGYNFPWQSPGFFAPRNFPNCIVTVFVGEALLEAFRLSGEQRYFDALQGIASFLLDALPVLEEDTEKKCIGYVPAKLTWKVTNINAVAAGFLAKWGAVLGETRYLESSRKMIRYVCDVRSQEGTWSYTEPESQSGIGPDNYHTGGILDGILDYMRATGDWTTKELYLESLGIYGERFFTKEKAPRWRLNSTYPCDIHGTAQGVLSFSKASSLDPLFLNEARSIAEWAIRELQDQEMGCFYYRKYRYFVWKKSFMRWCNSWMLMALGETLYQESRVEEKAA